MSGNICLDGPINKIQGPYEDRPQNDDFWRHLFLEEHTIQGPSANYINCLNNMDRPQDYTGKRTVLLEKQT